MQIPPEFHTWALKWLEHENAKEVETRESVRVARQKAYDQAVRMLDRYTDMRARDELTEEEYRAKKAHALKEKARCFALLNNTDAQITRWADNMETVLNLPHTRRKSLRGAILESVGASSSRLARTSS